MELTVMINANLYTNINLCTPENVQQTAVSYIINSKDSKDTPLTKPHILLVEDTVIAQKITKVILEDLGCLVDIAINGIEAINMYNTNEYGLIVLDVGLPDISGVEVCEIIRRQEMGSNLHTPIVAITAFGEFAEQDCKDAGVDDFFVKPVLEDSFRQILGRWLPNLLL
jgi:CheY-like chemotaxis protein